MDDITDMLAEMVGEIAPDVRLVLKYGGHVMCPLAGNDKSFVGGIFAYKDHVSLEFSQGAQLDDPKGLLEGKGKQRRHLKFTSIEEIQSKEARAFLVQIL